jgi:hypothetical protein
MKPIDVTVSRGVRRQRADQLHRVPAHAQPRHAHAAGVALILTLGLLSLVTLAAVAFVVTMRIERLATNHTVHRTMAREYADVGLNTAMGLVNEALALNRSCYPVQGWSTNAGRPHFFERDCFGAPSTNDEPILLLRGAATNLLPGILAAQAAIVESGWQHIHETNETTGAAGILAGRVAFLVVNLSGMADVNALNSNRWQALGEPSAAAYQRLNPTGAYQRVFLTQSDLYAANQGPVSNLITRSYDAGPDVYFTDTAGLGTRAFAGSLRPRTNINLATHDTEVATVSTLLASAGVTDSVATAWNIRNYLDTGRIPLGPGPEPTYRTGIGVKDVPLINKVVLADSNATMQYSVAVELWYPFVPNNSPTNAKIWVGVYTNVAPNTAAEPADADFTYEMPLPIMQYAGPNEFFVASMPGTITFSRYDPVSATWIREPLGTNLHQIWVWPRVYVGTNCVDEALLKNGSVVPWTQPRCYQFNDPRANHDLANAIFADAPLSALGTTNSNCSIPSLPLVHANAPMQSAGELRHIYAPGLSGGRIDFTTAMGGACRDRFTVQPTNTPTYGLFQANTPYANIWQAILCDVPIGWTNAIVPDFRRTLGTDRLLLEPLAASLAGALTNSGQRGTTCFEALYPLLGSTLLTTLSQTNSTEISMDARAVCGDILAGIADRVSFRQNSYLIIVCGQRLSPLGRVLADQRAAITIVRDAYTGRWVVDHLLWLTE